MLGLTKRASHELKKTLSECDCPRRCFRLTITQHGPQLLYDEPLPGDVALKDEERVVVVVDRAIANRLGGHRIDYEADAARLVLRAQA